MTKKEVDQIKKPRLPVTGEKLPNEVELTQYMRPYGKQRKIYADVGADVAKKSEGMVLECEDLGDGTVALYLRWEKQKKEKEIIRLAINGPGANEPNEVLKRAILELYDKKKAKKR